MAGLRRPTPRVHDTKLGPYGVEGGGHVQRLVQRHHRALPQAFGQAAVDLLDLEAEAVALVRRVDLLDPALVVTVSEFGQCIIAGRSITPSVPDDPRRARHAHPEGRLDHAQPSRRMMQDRGDHLVDAGLADHAVGHDALDRAQDERAQLHGVDPQVEQRTAAELASEEPVRRAPPGAGIRSRPRPAVARRCDPRR